MQAPQTISALERTATVLATMFLAWMVRKGWLGESDAATLLPAIVLLPSVAWGLYNNRNTALVQKAAAIPGTVVVTSPELSAATPDQKNIVPNNLPTPVIAAVMKEVKADAADSQAEQKT